jgi:hypothetical protein
MPGCRYYSKNVHNLTNSIFNNKHYLRLSGSEQPLLVKYLYAQRILAIWAEVPLINFILFHYEPLLFCSFGQPFPSCRAIAFIIRYHSLRSVTSIYCYTLLKLCQNVNNFMCILTKDLTTTDSDKRQTWPLVRAHTKTHCLTDRQSQLDFDLDFDFDFEFDYRQFPTKHSSRLRAFEYFSESQHHLVITKPL